MRIKPVDYHMRRFTSYGAMDVASSKGPRAVAAAKERTRRFGEPVQLAGRQLRLRARLPRLLLPPQRDLEALVPRRRPRHRPGFPLLRRFPGPLLQLDLEVEQDGGIGIVTSGDGRGGSESSRERTRRIGWRSECGCRGRGR